MLVLKNRLPSVGDARIYLSVERTFLGYVRLALYLVSFGIFLKRSEIFLLASGMEGFSMVLEGVVVVSGMGGAILSLSGLLTFRKDIKYLDGGTSVEPKEVRDPRIYMAAERTFLAWVRTAIALIVFGFVIEKFEFFLMQLEKLFQIHIGGSYQSLAGVGVFIVFVGLLTVAVGLLNFYRTIKQVDRGVYRTNTLLYKAYGVVIFLSCFVLTFFLLRLI